MYQLNSDLMVYIVYIVHRYSHILFKLFLAFNFRKSGFIAILKKGVKGRIPVRKCNLSPKKK